MTTGKFDDGGSAFPIPDVAHADGSMLWGKEGMSVLDWFAGQEKLDEDEPNTHVATALMGEAPPVFVANPASGMRCAKWWAEASARLRYMRAAAMVAEKRRREGGGT